MTNNAKSAVTWSDVKAKLSDFDRIGLLGLVQDLYTTTKDNHNFLHARFASGLAARLFNAGFGNEPNGNATTEITTWTKSGQRPINGTIGWVPKNEATPAKAW